MPTRHARWEVEKADDVYALMLDIVEQLGMRYIDVERVHCVRSKGSGARAYARVWGLSRIFQITAGFPAVYVIEVLAQHYDKLSEERKKKVIIHELLHIPRTFSGALKSHKSGSYRVDHHEVEKMYEKMRR